jgi:uncharacterized protein (TIGR03382 family)
VQISVETRVDAYLDFISGFMADAGDPPDCDADGRCGFHCAAPDPDCPCAPDGLCTSGCPTPEADPDCTQSCLFDGGSCLGQRASTSGSSGSGGGNGDSGCNAAGGIGLAAWLILGIGLALTRRRG